MEMIKPDVVRCGAGMGDEGRSVKVTMSPAGLIKNIQTRVVMRVK